MDDTIDYTSLIRLDKNKQIAFVYLTAIRAMPTLTSFCKKYQFGDINVLERTLMIFRQSIFNLTSYSNNQLTAQLENLDSNVPATNDFPNHDGTVAQDCGGVFYCGLQLLVDDNSQDNLKDISTFLTDAIDAYVVTKENLEYGESDFEEKIASNPVMIGEINIQNQIIKHLKNITSITGDDLNYLVEMQKPNVIDLIIS